LILAAEISSIVDSADCADDKYDSAVNASLSAILESAPQPAMTPPAS
jgi:hypothetical protein